ncbi:peptide deformylase [Companilactobacillus crustorum]|uniref:Peptide deformylase n=3 Tax=Companilactobacillus TaxID=2767879 RepID=A0A837REZ0_9LACO|nr:peptide deformylase [Companilactobacillus crustorum]KRK41238.1 peptide deformylase [Companilactobacillus crustorum JCM 15951]KRO18101.1 peptide deformylase [Companilactobacillus crustorum]GEO77467.1 peptide deformylase [Companilactobacillus crustorum]
MYFMKDIVRDGDPVLRKVGAKVQFPLSDKDKALAANMMEYLVKSQDEEYAEKHQLRAGVGLAAPQVGVSEMMASVLVPNEEDPDKPLLKITLINPVIVRNSVQRAALSEGEGCLSVDKDVPGFVPRADRITIKYDDFEGNSQTLRVKGYPAIVCQHEIDHLNGHLYYDKINKTAPFDLDPSTVVIS